MTWKSGNESTVRGYKFTYDGLDRMLNATYGETASISTNANRFSENVTGYDKNGNIKSLQRYGQTGASAYGLLDNLTLTLNGNQLSCVEDAVSTAAYGTNTAFVNGASVAGEYAYDVNGNLTKDLNKGITDIQYNVLNLPSTVSFSDGSTITYTYGADGTKLRTVHKIGSTTTTTDYCGNVIYENGTQKLLLTEEGYINLTGTQQYHYYLKDHQGNNRVVINQSGTVEETNHYYPFGGVFGTAGNTQPYKYNGKELDTKKGLNWYDYGARHYDTALGRFTTNDRFAEKYYSMSPYQYGANSPVVNIDVNGDSIRICTETQSFGHTWISVGEGSNMTVYSYGRYNGTNKGPDRSSNSLGNGSGVLLKLMGDEAKAYNDKKAADGMSVFVVTDVADEKVANILDEKFNMSTTMPDNPKSDYYNSSSARIIDEYKLTSNNCTTMVSDVLNKSGSNALKETRLQQTSNFGTWTTIPIVNRFILPISMQNHLVRISKPGGVVYKTR
ncbi:MAG: RHS repeat-associated core domain-containing protein [Bacteroides uniformis]